MRVTEIVNLNLKNVIHIINAWKIVIYLYLQLSFHIYTLIYIDSYTKI